MVYKTFTAANTARGFFSFFDEFIYSKDVKKLYLIKGGPGCGKSTFMKKIADLANKNGYTVEKVLCSSDKDSLDGIKIFEKNTVIIDATSPHAYDMKYPGVGEAIIDFSSFWNSDILEEKGSEIKSLSYQIKQKYSGVYSQLKVAGSIENYKMTFVEKRIKNDKIADSIKKILKQNAIVKNDREATVTNRMLSAFSKDGIYTESQTDELLCDSYVVLDDSIDIANSYLSRTSNAFAKMGYDCLRIHSPLLPEHTLEQVIIPELRLGFIASGHIYSPKIDENKIIKKIPTKNFIDKDFYKENKNKIGLWKKMNKDIIDGVCREISVIKDLHDKLELQYKDAVDYKNINVFTDEFIQKVIG